MTALERTFEWIDLPEGRARFSGIQRGWDEQGRVTFGLEIDGAERYGQLDQVFRDNGNDYDIEVITFGFGRPEDVGMPGAQVAVTGDLLLRIESLVIGLVQAARRLERPPNILVEGATSSFMGNVLFRAGWALVAAPDQAGAQS